MEEILQTLRSMGIPEAEIEVIRESYRNDVAGLRQYMLYLRAAFDDRCEYVD